MATAGAECLPRFDNGRLQPGTTKFSPRSKWWKVSTISDAGRPTTRIAAHVPQLLGGFNHQLSFVKIGPERRALAPWARSKSVVG
jgi:hypothetical protein